MSRPEIPTTRITASTVSRCRQSIVRSASALASCSSGSLWDSRVKANPPRSLRRPPCHRPRYPPRHPLVLPAPPRRVLQILPPRHLILRQHDADPAPAAQRYRGGASHHVRSRGHPVCEGGVDGAVSRVVRQERRGVCCVADATEWVVSRRGARGRCSPLALG